MIEDIKKATAAQMKKAVEALATELQKVRTGRAHPSLLDHITVSYYGSEVPLSQVANVNVEDARTLTVTPWEKTMVQPVEKAIMQSDLGLNPNTAATVIRVPLPPLTEERRKELVRVINKVSEEHKVAVRNIRRDANEMLKDLKKEGDISEDEAFKAQDQVQKITDDHINLVEQITKEKEKEILEF